MDQVVLNVAMSRISMLAGNADQAGNKLTLARETGD